MKKIIGLLLLVGVLSSCANIGSTAVDICYLSDMYYLSDGTLIIEKTEARIDTVVGVVIEGNRTVEPVRMR